MVVASNRWPTILDATAAPAYPPSTKTWRKCQVKGISIMPIYSQRGRNTWIGHF